MYLQPEMHIRTIFSLAIEGRLTAHDLPGLDAFAEFENLELISVHGYR